LSRENGPSTSSGPERCARLLSRQLQDDLDQVGGSGSSGFMLGKFCARVRGTRTSRELASWVGPASSSSPERGRRRFLSRVSLGGLCKWVPERSDMRRGRQVAASGVECLVCEVGWVGPERSGCRLGDHLPLMGRQVVVAWSKSEKRWPGCVWPVHIRAAS
jgi:hypothetical protein